jgi:hypothetical protein
MKGNRSRVTGKNEWGPAAPAGFHLDGVDGLPDFGDADVGRHVGGDSTDYRRAASVRLRIDTALLLAVLLPREECHRVPHPGHG